VLCVISYNFLVANFLLKQVIITELLGSTKTLIFILHFGCLLILDRSCYL
jgi:hypothetical protein